MVSPVADGQARTRSALRQCDSLLHGTGRLAPASLAELPWWWLPAMAAVFAPIYGGMMGSLYLDSTGRILQVIYSAVKVPLLLFTTGILCLPAFFVLNTIMGLRSDLRAALRAILAGQAGMGIALASLSPLIRFWYFCSGDYRSALLFNAAMFGTATLAGHAVMWRYYRHLIRRHRAHAYLLVFWVLLYVFVGIQMGWTLRPFVGAPGTVATFFRQEPFTNAYVVVAELLFKSW